MPTGSSSLASAAERKLLDQLQDFIKDESRKSIFAVGGAIPINHEPHSDNEPASPASTNTDVNVDVGGKGAAETTQIIEPEESPHSPPVIIRWDAHQASDQARDNLIGRIQLPPSHPDGNSDLTHLVSSCQPAKFGRGQVDVYDESYRKAGKLDSSDFSTNFNPYEFGIIDSVAKMLLPSVVGGPDADLDCSRGIRAELYKLNVYSAPSGKFKPHVDTPRSPAQFGSLVVSLPSQHEGGQLVVRHHGEEITFDWSTKKTSKESPESDALQDSAIRWAAFYSDCEHEVLEVTEGHRITLTYNLYVVSRGTPSGLSSMNPELLPVCQFVKDTLAQPGFLSKGAVLGFNCTHAYAHTNKARVTNGDIHSSLKGIDMAMYVALRAAGLEVHLRPVLEDAKAFSWDGPEEYMSFSEWRRQSLAKADRSGRQWDSDKWGYIEEWFDQHGNMVRDPSLKSWIRKKWTWRSDGESGEIDVDVNDTDEDVDFRLEELERYRRFLKAQKAAFVGKRLWPFSMSDVEIGEGPTLVDVFSDWNGNGSGIESEAQGQCEKGPGSDFKGFHEEAPKPTWDRSEDQPYEFVQVQWMNEPIHREPAIGYLTYGNQSSGAMAYSRLAILARVPPFLERQEIEFEKKTGRHVE